MQNFNHSDYTDLKDLYKNAPMAKFVKRLKTLGLSCYFGLIAYYPILFTVLEQDVASSPLFPLVFFWLPLVTAAKGLLQSNPYTYAWSNFVIMWCYLHGLTAIWTYTGNKFFILIEVVLLTGAFIGNTYFARYRGRELGLALPKIKELKEKEKELFEK